MKKLVYLLLAVIFLSAIPAVSYAQSDDPFEQKTLKANNYGSTKREKKISRKKGSEETAPQAPATEAPKAAEKPANEMTISNACSDWLDVEFVSLIGGKGSQTVTLTIKVTNHSTNASHKVGHYFVSYDEEGTEHNDNWSSANTSKILTLMTDVPVKYTMTIPGKISHAKTKVMPVISFNAADCRIEMRNVPINWK